MKTYFGRIALMAVASLVLVQLTGCVGMDMYKGKKAYDKKDFTTAVEHFKKAAETGDAEAQYYLGRMCFDGNGMPKDSTEAVRWMRMSGEKGYAPAQLIIGVEYYFGGDPERDYGKAAEWFKKAAEQDNPGGHYFMGWIYATGRGVEKDRFKALNSFRLALANGYPVPDHLLTEEGVSRIKSAPVR